MANTTIFKHLSDNCIHHCICTVYAAVYITVYAAVYTIFRQRPDYTGITLSNNFLSVGALGAGEPYDPNIRGRTRRTKISNAAIPLAKMFKGVAHS
jgi:hypothetical protein